MTKRRSSKSSDPSPLSNAVPSRDEVIAELSEAFDNVTRAGGVSWTESEALDNFALPAQCAAARASDKDRHWRELANDPKWRPFPGVGGFSFLDEIGLRYYLTPMLIRYASPLSPADTAANPGDVLGLIEQASGPSDDRAEPALSRDQLRALARYVLHMSRAVSRQQHRFGSECVWSEALENRWKRYL